MSDVVMQDDAVQNRGAARKTKGRGGARDDGQVDDRYAGAAGIFQTLDAEGDEPGPARCMIWKCCLLRLLP